MRQEYLPCSIYTYIEKPKTAIIGAYNCRVELSNTMSWISIVYKLYSEYSILGHNTTYIRFPENVNETGVLIAGTKTSANINWRIVE